MTTSEKLHTLLSNNRYLVSGVEFKTLLPMTGLKVMELARALKDLIDKGLVEIKENSTTASRFHGETFVTYRVTR